MCRECTRFRQIIFTNEIVDKYKGRLSNAVEGNFLEANNLALNVFEKVIRAPKDFQAPSHI